MATSAVFSLATAFGLPTGVKDVGDLVRRFDFSNLRMGGSHEGLKFALAPSFGTLTSDSIKRMDDKLKVIIVEATGDIASLENKSWANVIATLNHNPLLEPMNDETTRTSSLSKKGTNVFKFDGSPEHAIVREVQAWFTNLVQGMSSECCCGVCIGHSFIPCEALRT